MLSRYKLELRALILAIGGALVAVIWELAFSEVGEVPWWTYFCVTGLSIFVLSYGLMSEWVLGGTSLRQLKEMEAYRREFLSDVSHELRTAVFVVQGFLDALRDESKGFSADQRRLLDRSSSNLAHLTQLIEDIRSTSLLESGAIRMQYTFFEMSELIEGVFEEFEATARKTKVRLLRSGRGSTSVYADRKYIGQVMRNLIQNAILYNRQKGSVVVELELKRKNVKVSVQDTGIGIPPEEQSRIFERFYRVEKSRSQARGGTGIGLALVKHILQAHQTSIHLRSEENGSDFWFILPSERPDR